ncbi:MAG: hypothetical protein CME62_11250 [Halobacteriovoraceae bacterium]|nr:hypothetical protein [Halobacteriovoraceae bacterium]|tara:strand:- start:6406 stop:7587 length:1182 start_codon:yes stop_codon:yes gene_type:complete
MGAFAQYYDTLPEGRRFLLYKSIQSEVKSSYNQSMTEIPYSYQVDADIRTLEKIEDERVEAILEVFKEYPDVYEQISLGNHQIEAKADVNVEVLAAGYGITDRIMAYVGIPIYEANVQVKYNRAKNSSEQVVADMLKEKYGDNWAQTLGNLVDQVYGIDEGTIQSGITNALGYEELGDWRGEGLGDIEFGVMYNFYRQDTHGLKLTVGGIAPTGYTDDPDILQDVGFGDGQWDAFVEFGGGYILTDDIDVNAWARYTYQFEHEREMRVPYDEDIKESDEKKSFIEKKGNRQTFGIDAGIYITDWFKFNPAFIYEHTDQSTYRSDNKEIDNILAAGTETYTQSVRLTAQLTTVRLFQQGKFIAPAQINLSAQNMIQGQNTPKVDMLELEFRMFF